MLISQITLLLKIKDTQLIEQKCISRASFRIFVNTKLYEVGKFFKKVVYWQLI